MVKMHKLTKGGQTIFPATIYDAVVNPNTRKSLTTELSELENEEIYLKTQIEGSIDKDLITENTVWIDGTWDWETNSSAGNSIQKQNYKHTKLTDVGYYDTLKMSGLSEKVDVSDIFPSISIYSGSEQIEYLRGSSAVINMDKYSDRSNINIIIQAKQDNSIIPSVIANSKAKVVKPEELIPIQSSLKKIEGSETDVVDALVWNKKRWETGTNQPNGGELQYNATQKIWYARIDISEYDSIICDGLLNGSSISTSASTLNGICIYGDNILIKGIKDASNENIINRSDYSQYSKLELILQCKSTSDNEFIAVGEPSVVVYKAGISSEKPKPKRVVIVGDSLCGNDTALIRYELGNILKNRGYELIPHTQGGEKTIGNLTRAGGIGIRVKGEFTIPANGTVICALESAWIKSDGNYQDTPYNSISSGQNVQVVINGIRGKLAKQAIDAVGIVFYTENGTFIKSLSETGTHSIPSSATKYAFTINNPNVGEPHITINEDTVDIETNATRDGYIDSKGQYHYSELFKCSELLPINQGEIYFDSLATSLLYEFTRLEEGRETKIGVGNVFFDAALYDDKDYPHIWFTGQNSGYESEEDWVNMVRSSANNFSEKYIVCSTPLVATNAKLIYQANKCFGARYINLRAYTQGQAVYDGQALGIIEGQYTASDYETLFWPGSDKIHQNNLLSYIWAAKMWNTLLELGYVEGERIETGDYYLP